MAASSTHGHNENPFGAKARTTMIRNRHFLVNHKKVWWIGSKKKRGRRGAFTSQPHLVFSQSCALCHALFKILSTQHSSLHDMLHDFFSDSTAPLHVIYIIHFCCGQKVEVERRLHTQPSTPGVSFLSKRGRRPRTNIIEDDLFFW